MSQPNIGHATMNRVTLLHCRTPSLPSLPTATATAAAGAAITMFSFSHFIDSRLAALDT